MTDTAHMNVVELGPHENMTPAQALAHAAREEWDDVIIIGYHKNTDDFVARSSHMARAQSLWLTEHLRLHVLGRLKK